MTDNLPQHLETRRKHLVQQRHARIAAGVFKLAFVMVLAALIVMVLAQH